MYSHTHMATLKSTILLAAVTLFCCPDARADIYKCSDEDGNLVFQQTPCAKKEPVEDMAEETPAIDAEAAEPETLSSDSSPGDPPQPELVELCKKKYRDAIDEIDAELDQEFSSEQGEAYRQRLQVLTKQLRAC